jgi:hypothetical protein
LTFSLVAVFLSHTKVVRRNERGFKSKSCAPAESISYNPIDSPLLLLPACPPLIASIDVTLPAQLLPKCNSQHKLTRVAANFAANNCTGTMILFHSPKELRSNVCCVAAKDFTANAGRKKHWPKVRRWRTTPNFNAATDARCAMPTPPRFKRWAKLLNR